MHPNTGRVLREDYDIDIGSSRPKSLEAFEGRRFDLVITLCDKVREVPRDHGSAVTTHWSLPDPSSAADTNRAAYPEFRRVAKEIDTRIGFLTL